MTLRIMFMTERQTAKEFAPGPPAPLSTSVGLICGDRSGLWQGLRRLTRSWLTKIPEFRFRVLLTEGGLYLK